MDFQQPDLCEMNPSRSSGTLPKFNVVSGGDGYGWVVPHRILILW